jgi:hypothetical protein
MLSRISLVIGSSFVFGGCALLPPIKTDVADVPICRALHERPQTKEVKDIGPVTLMRPNPTCMKEVGEAKCGYCVWTVSDKSQFVGDAWNKLLPIRGKKKKWSTIVSEGGIIPAESQASLKEFGINVCKATQACGQEIDRWRIKWDAADSIAEGLKPR